MLGVHDILSISYMWSKTKLKTLRCFAAADD